MFRQMVKADERKKESEGCVVEGDGTGAGEEEQRLAAFILIGDLRYSHR